MLLTKLAQRNLILKLEDAISVTGTVRLRQPAAQVFDFIATPAHWPQWHSSTGAVRSAPFAPLLKGDRVTEQVRVLGRRFDVRWTVVSAEPPQRWSMAADSPEGVARISYVLTPEGSGCVLVRRLQFRSKGWAWPCLDSSLNRWFLARQSAQALQRLQQVLASATR